MKKTLLIFISIFCLLAANAQKRIGVTTPINKPFRLPQRPGTFGSAAASCDTLKYDSAFNLWTPNIWRDSTNNKLEGYVIGVNKDFLGASFDEDANYYDVSGSDYTYVTGGLVYFAVANSTSDADLNKNLFFKIYADNGSGLPGTLLGSTAITLLQIKKDVKNDALTEFQFATPVALPANKIFYVSVDHSNFEWTNSLKDSIAIYGDSSNQAPPAAYQYISNAGVGWTLLSNFWGDATENHNPLELNSYIFPYVNNSSTGCITLPVSIINFKGSIENKQAVLSWTTATEFNNKGFSIERSKDGKTFAQIGFVNGAGTTTQRKNYTFTDITLNDFSASTNYYRLKQVDLDGKTTYSNVLPLSLKNIPDWKLYPNPIKDKITVELNLTADSKVNVQVLTKDGKLLLNADKGTLAQGQQQLSLNIQNLPAGSYYVRIKAGDRSYTQVIVKQ